MFDIGFMELGLIAVVALLVIGPERLPAVARTAGKWIGTARRFVNTVQADIHAEVSKAEELKNVLEEQTKLQSVHEILETKIPEESDRQPVPRAKPEYQVKAIPDKPVNESASVSSEAVSKEKSAEQKHD